MGRKVYLIRSESWIGDNFDSAHNALDVAVDQCLNKDDKIINIQVVKQNTVSRLWIYVEREESLGEEAFKEDMNKCTMVSRFLNVKTGAVMSYSMDQLMHKFFNDPEQWGWIGSTISKMETVGHSFLFTNKKTNEEVKWTTKELLERLSPFSEDWECKFTSTEYVVRPKGEEPKWRKTFINYSVADHVLNEMDERGWDKQEVANRYERLNEAALNWILSGEYKLSQAGANALNTVFGGTREYWLGIDRKYWERKTN